MGADLKNFLPLAIDVAGALCKESSHRGSRASKHEPNRKYSHKYTCTQAVFHVLHVLTSLATFPGYASSLFFTQTDAQHTVSTPAK